ncbi:MAG: indolepyruvate ferredoxin oxidoreductase subunit alpha [Desulfovibrionaceae bacterium]
MSHLLLSAASGERHLLLGNEAIVRGALEAGINVITCYPGTPSSEVPDTFQRMGGEGRYRIEYSVNEKVAMEVGAGAAISGAMTLVTMKHVGVNVAADPLFTLAYIGAVGGLVLLSADDPGCHSSQNEQDNRQYARFAGLPCFEPATAQEAKDMTRDALRLARNLEQPVLLRTCTRLNHLRGPVNFGPLPDKAAPAATYTRQPMRNVPVPAVARNRHTVLEKNLGTARAIAEESPWNTVHSEAGSKCRLGIITSGIARAYLADALHAGQWENEVKVLQLGMTWPLPEKMLCDFLSSCDRVLVVEEGAALLEHDVCALAQQRAIPVSIVGKGAGLTIFGEYSNSLVMAAVATFLGHEQPPVSVMPAKTLPMRPPNLCPGCSHRAVYYAVRQIYGDTAVYSSDIGCYTLGMVPPLRMADFLVCMGSSISAGSGFAIASPDPVVAFIGDSTFFHSGITGLANAVFNRHNVLVVILDNGTTAMTGHQPNPGMRQDILGESAAHLDIEAIVRALGVQEFARVKAYNVRSVMQAVESMKAKTGVRVILTEEPCVLYARRTLKKRQTQVAVVVQQGADAQRCLEELACPAFSRQAEGLTVDPTLCTGCMVCLQVAPKAFKAQALKA